MEYITWFTQPVAAQKTYSISIEKILLGHGTFQGLIMGVQRGNYGNHPGVIDYQGHSYLFYFD